MDYKEPIKGHIFKFEMIRRGDLVGFPYQRPFSSALSKKLINSVSAGFITPVIAVEGPNGYEVIDGQHRLATVDQVQYGEDVLIPTIIVPEEFRNYPLFLNIEKSDNIKDKCQKLHRLYVDKAQTDETESDIMPAANYESYLFTMAFAHIESGLQSPSLVEPPIKKIDKSYLTRQKENGLFEPMPVSEAIEIRRARGVMARQLEDAVQAVADENSISDFNLKRAIVSKSSQALWGMRRKIDDPFEDAISSLIDQINEMDWSWMEGR